MNPKYKYHCGFTLVEVLLATIIGTLVAMVALGIFHAVSRNWHKQQRQTELLVHGRYAMKLMRDDLANFYRSQMPERMKLQSSTGKIQAAQTDRLVFFTVSRIKSQKDSAEGDLYEVEYFLEKQMDEPIKLIRRYAPVDDDAIGNRDGSRIEISKHIHTMRFEFFDGKQWSAVHQQSSKPPRLIRITLGLTDPEDRDISVEISQIVSIMRLPNDAGTFVHAPGTLSEPIKSTE